MVLPASAGMIRTYEQRQSTDACAPRIRGDDPPVETITDSTTQCSPHPRG